MYREYRFDTRLIHEFDDFEEGAVNKPIYQSTSFSYKSAEELASIFQKEAQGFIYTRINNPTIAAFETKMTSLEDGLGAVCCSSGMAAIATAVLSIVEQGDEVIAGNSLFGGTYNFLQKDLGAWGIKTKFVEATNPEAFLEAITGRTKLIFIETVGNPKLDIPDVEAISGIAHQHGIPLMVDNTFMTPYLFKAKDYGADIVIHSTSKFINGSANSIGGIIIDLGTFKWPAERYPVLSDYQKYGPYCYLAKIRQDIFRNLGVCASPFNTFLNIMGLETLAVRMDKHCANGLRLATFLANHSVPVKVTYPGLSSHPQYLLAKKQFAGNFGGLVTFELRNQEEAFRVINSLKLAKNLANIGDIRTLVIHPASTIYCNLAQEQQRELGVTPGLIRVSVGIENPDDIIEDFNQALESLA